MLGGDMIQRLLWVSFHNRAAVVTQVAATGAEV